MHYTFYFPNPPLTDFGADVYRHAFEIFTKACEASRKLMEEIRARPEQFAMVHNVDDPNGFAMLIPADALTEIDVEALGLVRVGMSFIGADIKTW